MFIEDLDIPAHKLGDVARRVLDNACEEARRRQHGQVATEHLFIALAQVDWDQFAEAMRALEISPHAVLQQLEDRLRQQPATAQPDVSAGYATKAVLKLALHHASRAGHPTLDSIDILLGLFEDEGGGPAAILRKFGAAPEKVLTELEAMRGRIAGQNEWLKKRFELPAVLAHFATNLNLLARQDRIPPVYGRDDEIDQVLEVLCHRERANSVMLIGEPGVGKTAIVEGLARRLEFDPDRIPVRLRACQVVNLQMNAIVAGTMLRGMFEERMQSVIKELKEHPNLILFVDEAHTLIGAGSALGAPSDAANVLKSVLARGEIRLIGATTSSEYKQHIEEDEALARRFRTVAVAEPTIEETRVILDRLRPRLERNYAVRLLDEAITTALEMAPRYMRHLRLPDKAIGWLDTAAVRAELGGRWDVTRDDVITVISHHARIPADLVYRDVTERFADLESGLQKRVVGQGDAVRAVARRLVLNKGPLKDGFDRPDGVLLFLGPTGVGKTELAKAVAEFLFGDEKKMVRVDMSEYQDASAGLHKLIGTPRGVMGSERGGTLTTALRDNPYTVVLLDEVEKANSALLNLFLQAFDEGWLTDGRGRRVYLSDAIVIMTSNLGSEHFRKLTNPLGFLSAAVDPAQVRGDIVRELERRFSPEFRNRIDETVIFAPLGRDDVREIASAYLATIARTLAASGKSLQIDDAALDRIVVEGYNVAHGARFLKRVIDERIKAPLSRCWREASSFRVCVDDRGLVVEPVAGALAAA